MYCPIYKMCEGEKLTTFFSLSWGILVSITVSSIILLLTLYPLPYFIRLLLPGVFVCVYVGVHQLSGLIGWGERILGFEVVDRWFSYLLLIQRSESLSINSFMFLN